MAVFSSIAAMALWLWWAMRRIRKQLGVNRALPDNDRDAVDLGGQLDRGFQGQWVLANTVGVVVGAVVATIAVIALDAASDFLFGFGVPHGGRVVLIPLQVAVAVGVIGAAVGVSQQRVLRRYVPWARWWVGATVVGWVVGTFVGLVVGFTVQEFFRSPGDIGAEPAIALGLAVGLAQWVLLRRQVSSSGLWIVANIVGWSLALGTGLVFLIFAALFIGNDYIAIFVGVPVVGVVAGAITGTVLVRLSQQPAAPRSDREEIDLKTAINSK